MISSLIYALNLITLGRTYLQVAEAMASSVDVAGTP